LVFVKLILRGLRRVLQQVRNRSQQLVLIVVAQAKNHGHEYSVMAGKVPAQPIKTFLISASCAD
jgi:hypothetical protein